MFPISVWVNEHRFEAIKETPVRSTQLPQICDITGGVDVEVKSQRNPMAQEHFIKILGPKSLEEKSQSKEPVRTTTQANEQISSVVPPQDTSTQVT